jgi:hypothetical protein
MSPTLKYNTELTPGVKSASGVLSIKRVPPTAKNASVGAGANRKRRPTASR